MTEGDDSPGVLLVRFQPSSGAAGGHWRSNLQPTDSAAPSAPHRQRQSPRSLAGCDHLGERQDRPPITSRAIGVQLVAAGVQASDAAEVDHGPRVLRSEAHRASHTDACGNSSN